MDNTSLHIRFAPNSEAISVDFAEHLKYSLDADEVHNTESSRYIALAYAIRDRIIHQWHKSRSVQRRQRQNVSIISLWNSYGKGNDEQYRQSGA
jgi:hypothetical protein